jgi:hypothetical protein
MQRCWDQDPHLRPEVSEVLRVLPPPLVCSFWRSYICLLDRFLVCSEDPAWKRLIGHTLTMPEYISLIATVFSDNNQVKMVENLIGDDAQNLIDMIDNVSLTKFNHTFPPSRHQLIGFYSNPLHSVGYVGIG